MKWIEMKMANIQTHKYMYAIYVRIGVCLYICLYNSASNKNNIANSQGERQKEGRGEGEWHAKLVDTPVEKHATPSSTLIPARFEVP